MATGEVAGQQPARDGPEAAATSRRDGALKGLARAAAPDLVDDVGFTVPWHERLSTRLLLFVVAAVLLVAGGLTLAEARSERLLLEQVTAESERLSQTVRQALHRAMLQDRRTDAYQIMADVARQPGIEALRLVDGAGRVAYSTEAGEIGRVLDRRAGGCAACHAGASPVAQAPLEARSRLLPGREGRVLSIVAAVENEPGCSAAACHAHPAERQVLGVLDVGLSLSRLDAATAAFRWRTLGSTALAAALLGLAFWVMARRHLVRPVGALVQASRRVARQDLDEEIPDVFDGELGLLAGQFNAMTRALRRTRGELRSLLADLERRVAERTDAVEAAREELVRTEKLAAVGRMAASISHQINSPISGIMTFARLIARTLEHGPPDEASRQTTLRHLALVEREAEHCSEVVRGLLDFAHDRPAVEAELSPTAVVEEALGLCGNQLQIQGVTVEKRLDPLPHLLGDHGQLRQACVNVLMNACEAMPQGGRLAVTAGLVDDGAAVELAFADSGPGIPRERLQRVFDPFFSTKEQGTGLGLSVVHAVAVRHGGQVRIESEAGKGTRVTIRLPVRHREEGPPGAAS